MIDSIINFIKNLFIKKVEGPTIEALHNISIPMDTGDDIAKALGLKTQIYSLDIRKPELDHPNVTFIKQNLNNMYNIRIQKYVCQSHNCIKFFVLINC